MQVCKVIFRLDFRRVCFELMDRPGVIMRLLNQLGDSYWDGFQDSPASRMVQATFYQKEGTAQRQFSVEPTNLNFSFQDAKGCEISSLESNETFSSLMKVATLICEEFSVKEFQRAGLRLVCLGQIGPKGTSLIPVFAKLVDGALLRQISDSLGIPEDYGLQLDGQGADKIKYHTMLGPYMEKDSKVFFDKVEKHIYTPSEKNLILDLDLYEESFDMTIKPNAWARPLLLKASNLAKKSEAAITQKVK